MKVYSFLTTLLSPFLLPYLVFKTKRAPLTDNVLSRLGFYRGPVEVWIHGSSVGESRISIKLAEAIKKPKIVTCMTDTGYNMLKSKVENPALIPMDAPFAVLNALKRLSNLKTLILVESEIWPNLIKYAKNRGVSVVVVNARMSEKAFRRYKRLGFFKKVFSMIDLVLARSEEDGERFLEMGTNKVEVTGNIKLDIEGERKNREELGLPKEKIVVTFGSVREGEEELVAEAIKRTMGEGVVFVVAPRHPDRFNFKPFDIFDPSFRSKKDSLKGSVFILDTLGELNHFYSVSDIAVVCGSFLPYGGHNIVEPISFGVPTLFGPYMDNFKEEASIFGDGNGALSITPEKLGETLEVFIKNPEKRSMLSKKGIEVLKVHRGAFERTMEALMRNNYI